MTKVINFLEKIEEAKRIHKGKYDYSKAVYRRWDIPITIICPSHGEFKQILNHHVKGSGCPKCGKISSSEKMSLTTEEFIKRAKEIHGDKYNYSKVKYVNNHTKVCIICPKHGEFWQIPSNHLLGFGCNKCSGKKKKDTEEFITEAKKIHGNKYDYSKVEYTNNSTKVCIICPEHGEFWQTPNKHLRGNGCPVCRINKKLTLEGFIERAKKIHGNEYDYSKVVYVNERTKVCIVCPEHGEFWQLPSNHISGAGCPKCKRRKSKLEKMVENFLISENIKYEGQKNFEWLKYKNNMYLDFYLPDKNLAIECQGEQHSKPVKFFGGKKELEYVIKRDKKKKELCERNGITLIYFYGKKDINKIKEKINEIDFISGRNR